MNDYFVSTLVWMMAVGTLSWVINDWATLKWFRKVLSVIPIVKHMCSGCFTFWVGLGMGLIFWGPAEYLTLRPHTDYDWLMIPFVNGLLSIVPYAIIRKLDF